MRVCEVSMSSVIWAAEEAESGASRRRRDSPFAVGAYFGNVDTSLPLYGDMALKFEQLSRFVLWE